MLDKFIQKHQLEIKDIFESDYHLIADDEDLIKRLLKLAREADERVAELEEDLEILQDKLYDAENEIDDLRDQMD